MEEEGRGERREGREERGEGRGEKGGGRQEGKMVNKGSEKKG